MHSRRSRVVMLALALATASCATIPKDQAEVEALMWDAARECKARYGTIQSVDRIDQYGRLYFSYHGSGPDNNAFLECYQKGFEQKLRTAANLPEERVTRDPDAPSRVTVPAEAAGGVALIMVRINGTTDARMMVDSGASFTILSPSIASKLGLSIPVHTRQSIVEVAGGRQITMPRIRLASAKVGSVAVENLYIGVYDAFPNTPQVQGLLGVDFLRHFRVSFEQSRERLVLDTPE